MRDALRMVRSIVGAGRISSGPRGPTYCAVTVGDGLQAVATRNACSDRIEVSKLDDQSTTLEN